MSKDHKTYDTKEMLLRGLLAFGRIFGAFANPMSDKPAGRTYTHAEARKRKVSHAKFKAQCAARRQQRRLA